MNLQNLIDKSTDYDQMKTDVTLPSSEISFYQDVADRVTIGNEKYGYHPMTSHALQQACDKHNGADPRYIGRCPGWLAATQMNHWQGVMPVKNQLLRFYNDDCRAVLSGDYVPLSNTSVLQILDNILKIGGKNGEQVEAKLVRPYITPDEMYIKCRIKPIGGTNYDLGVALVNGETGKNQLEVLPLLYRNSCDNSMSYAPGGWTQKHIHVSVAGLRAGLTETIGMALRVSYVMLEKAIEAEAIEIPSIADVITGIVKKHKLSVATHQQVLIGTEGKSTLMGLINGLSYAAHRTDGLNPSGVMDLEKLAGSFFKQVMTESVL